ncbi:1-acyl-sn-glycerol-3-phosphate acyltransferase [Ferrimonas sediminum]|uniref:1-acyl-sn-glycerol-3-phosphate acyltransferase n=1 Tax=Ferrimonas sediminum TaxID=718193 RepID=A0A1G8JN31_9GAMM|nr:1-acyl-sn-glycerol-3-phosphate acyltransferase [Ferrimonas sediminum]
MTTLRGVLAFLGYIINTLLWFPMVFGLGLLKLLPIAPLKRLCSWGADRCATTWIAINNLNQRLLSGTQVVVHPLPELSDREWYMVIANHQSWVDILMLQRLFIGKIPFIKFFLKAELIFVPFIGLCWWALDFPFMRRFNRQYLEKYPHMKGKDVETTRKACEKYKHSPVTIMNFVEGTRYTRAKHQRQESPFDQLLRPKAGGLAFTLDAMGTRLDKMLDVTIYYPDGAPSFWDFMCGRVRQVEISVEARSMEPLHRLGYDTPEDKAAFQDWLNTLWQEKERLLAQRSYEDKQ